MPFSPAASVCAVKKQKKHKTLQDNKKRMRASLHTAGVTSDILSFVHLSSYSLRRQVARSIPTQTRIKAAILTLAAPSQMKRRSRCLCSRSQWIQWSGTMQRTAESESRPLTQAAKQTTRDRGLASGHRRYIRRCTANCSHSHYYKKKEKQGSLNQRITCTA